MPKETRNIQDILDEILGNSEAIPLAQLYALSDLAQERLLTFRQAWEKLASDQRRRLILALVELAEVSFEVNFDAIFRGSLQDPDADVRSAAIEGLWENEEVSLVGSLLAALRADPAAKVRAAAAGSLGRFVLAGELEQLEAPIQARIMDELLTTIHLAGESIEVRRRALESVAYSSRPEVLEALEMAYFDEDAKMRLSAVVGMGRTCDRQWADTILTELQNPETAMRYEAALAAGELSLRQAVPDLARLTEDADQQVQDAAIWALGQIGGPQAKQVLLELYAEADDDTRDIVEEALAEQALLAGELDFTLYAVDPDTGEPLIWDDEELDRFEEEEFGDFDGETWDE
jgi:HEAT repeat protein